MVFIRSLGGAIFVSTGQNLFRNRVLSGVFARIPELDPYIILQTGVAEIRQAVNQSGLGGEDKGLAVVMEI